MAGQFQVAAYSGGSLRFLSSGIQSREVVLALPLSRLLVRLVRVPVENRSDPAAFAHPILQSISPYPDETLTVSCEMVRESPDGLVVIAAALPESAADDLAEALDAAKLNVTRVDVLALGAIRGLWNALGNADARRLLLLKDEDCISLLVIDGDLPSAIRAFTSESDLRREVMLSLLESEDFGGVRSLSEIVVSGDLQVDDLADLAPVRRIEMTADEALVGIEQRSEDPASLNALPESWREVLDESRLKRKLTRGLALAGGFWVLMLAVLLGVPMGYGFMTDRQKSLRKEHRRAYEAVREMRDKVRLVQKYSDHSRGALEVMKAVSDRLPQGVTLNSWLFRREDGVKVAGEADEADSIWKFQDAMTSLAGEGETQGVFGRVDLHGPTAVKGGRQKFDLDCRYEKESEN